MNVLLLLVLFVGIAIGFAAAFAVFFLGYRSAQLNLEEAKLERANQEFVMLSQTISEEKK